MAGLDSAMPLNSGPGFSAKQDGPADALNQGLNYRPDAAAGQHDVTPVSTEPAPHVVPTNNDTVNQHGPGPWDNNVYGIDPYANPNDNREPLPSGSAPK